MAHDISSLTHRQIEVARREFSQGFMSNAKWRKFFTAVDDSGVHISQIRVKLIFKDEPFTMGWPYLVDNTQAIWETPDGPAQFVSIEWLEIPAVARFPRPNNVPARELEQDIDSILMIFDKLGRYPIERTADALRLVGYAR